MCSVAVAAVLSVTTVDLIESEDAVVCVSIPSPACENTVFQLGTANGKCVIRNKFSMSIFVSNLL